MQKNSHNNYRSPQNQRKLPSTNQSDLRFHRLFGPLYVHTDHQHSTAHRSTRKHLCCFTYLIPSLLLGSFKVKINACFSLMTSFVGVGLLLRYVFSHASICSKRTTPSPCYMCVSHVLTNWNWFTPLIHRFRLLYGCLMNHYWQTFLAGVPKRFSLK